VRAVSPPLPRRPRRLRRPTRSRRSKASRTPPRRGPTSRSFGRTPSTPSRVRRVTPRPSHCPTLETEGRNLLSLSCSGEDPATAAPLLRGLIFECDRIVRNSIDALHPLQTTADLDTPAGDDADDDGPELERFYLIYGAGLSPYCECPRNCWKLILKALRTWSRSGTSVYALGQLIYLSAELALSSEPAPEAFFGKALDFLLTSPSAAALEEEAPLLDRLSQAASGDWKIQLARARAVVGLLAAAGSADEEVVEEVQVDPLLAWAISTTDGVLAQVGALPQPHAPAEGELSPPAQRDPATTFLPSPPTADQRLSLRLSAAVSVAGIVEALPPNGQVEAARWAEAQFGQIERTALALEASGERNAWQAKALVGRGGVRLALGATQAEQVVEAESGKEDKAYKAAAKQLRSALDDLSVARSLRPRAASPEPAPESLEGAVDEKDEDEIATLTVEACLTLIGLYESLGEDAGKDVDIQALEAKARVEGWEGYGEDDSEQEDD